MTLDKATREAIVEGVKRAALEMAEVYQEEWVTGEQLCAAVGFFTKEWLHNYGATLPRECVRVVDEAGVCHRTRWCYPKKKILRLISEGKLRGNIRLF